MFIFMFRLHSSNRHHVKAIHDVIVQLHNGIAIKELGTLHHFLGVDIMEFGDGLILSQRRTYNKLRWMVQKQNLLQWLPNLFRRY